MNIALITPKDKEDYMTNTVLDGLDRLCAEDASVMCGLSPYYSSPVPVSRWKLPYGRFISFAQAADLVIFFSGKGGTTDYETAEKIGRFDKTVFVDGSEPGKNNRLDLDIQRGLVSGTYEGDGRVDRRMLDACALYFRREKPYRIHGIDKDIIPLPFGIESKYIAYRPGTPKDIDFACVFGQEDYPPLRRQVRSALEAFCEKNGFSCRTSQTSGLFSDIYKESSRQRFYRTLARTKVGISVSGGGFDTARFWEILGNNCGLLTEKIDIYEEGSRALDYERIWQFNGIDGFKGQLAKVADFLKNGYNQSALTDEYGRIMSKHSTKARVMTILEAAEKKGIIISKS